MLTSLTAFLRLHRFEVYSWNRANELHWFRFNQTSVLLVPTGTLQVQTLDVDTVLKNNHREEIKRFGKQNC